MEAFRKHSGLVAPLDRVNVDTDQIIPKQFLKRIERTGFGQFLFYDWRFQPDGSPNSSFVLNDPRYREASILVTGPNFGCGSSREHAPWALMDHGFRVIIAPSFADIFTTNCFKNGLLTVMLPADAVTELIRRTQQTPGYRLTVNLETRTVADGAGFSAVFPVDDFRRHCLLNGLDEISLTLQHEPEIAAYEARHALRSIGIRPTS
jgi:3-isopropylmalate/(R)-2-methylmalate dehydratase small subunit